jgi:hydrogenase-4 component B
MSLVLILTATALAGASGLPGLFLDPRRPWGQWIAAFMMSLSAVVGIAGAVMGLEGSYGIALALPSSLMGGGLTLGMDALSAFFLVPIFAMGGLGSIYGLGYWSPSEHETSGRILGLFWGTLVAGMSILVVARHAMVFLLGWEAMALSAFFLVGTESHLAEVRGAAFIYLIATHIGTLSLFAMFGLLRLASGSFDLKPAAFDGASLGMLTAIFCLAMLGFGLKAGLMPLHFWLPIAHASAPSHVSAMLSGVVIKMGVYGMVRITGLLPQPPVAWGAILLILGAVSGVLGVAFAIGQHDLKRLLAYHSIENIGIIVMGLGLAMAGRSMDEPDWVVLGLAGCLLHVWNHAAFKSLLFLSAGSVVHVTHTREIDRLGGLAQPMPWTSVLFLIGAVAICGLPPLNGFVSELLIYLGLLHTTGIGGGESWIGAALGVPVLAAIGALAVACFVKAYGVVFLGKPRGVATAGAHESPMTMIAPMILLAACCVLIGLAPFALGSPLGHAVSAWAPESSGIGGRLVSLAPLASIGIMSLVIWVMIGIVSTLFLWQHPIMLIHRACTWDCGYARPAPRMQYTSSSFTQMLVGLLRWPLRPRVHNPKICGVFPKAASFESHVDDVVLDGQLIPAVGAVQRWLAWLRGLQPGLTQHYVLYILVTVVAMLMWAVPFAQLLIRLFSR